ncbi:MAG: 6-phosphogluconolactonase [Gammaproteobacteria bacterium]|nr:6-phosphogluconolactonase [Gammaproteobacteria bacterium]NIM73048.1 6-phosphogluconolactonase [Gammaproteobacteria bacterium]NIN38665.1 6-phosphogluconolactonase [Gammaproteobacteria bacterium]NIO24801.1 6-phosphogluconolactonase [Gammaproteobacteria bacterium]NIO65404.1 6-phosphogluconolactonase [Gammaproteobacteria bacterium]
MSAPRLETRGDAGAAARAAARFVAAGVRRAVAERGLAAVAFSGGSTPLTMLEALVAEDLPWASLHVVQVDERTAPHGHADRNLTQLEETLLAKTPLAADNLHAMPVQEADLERAAARYAALLAERFGTPAVLDLVHLGLGDDGHTASLVPDDPALALTDCDVAVSGEYRGYRRMTLTLPILDRARQRLWLVTGAGKSAMLARLVAGDRSIPAGRVQARDAVVFADEAAARAIDSA